MSIVNRGLGFTRSLIMRGLGGVSPPDNTNNLVRELSINIEANIKPKRLFYPLTGAFSENENVLGWRYSRSFPQNLDDVYQRIENSIGGYEYNLEEGSIRDDWEGAVIENIALEKIVKVYKRNYSSEWLPKVRGGVYSIYWLEKSLYADESSCKIVEKEIQTSEEIDEDGNQYIVEEIFPYIDLPYGSSNIALTVFKRDKYFVNLPWIKYNFKNQGEETEATYTFEVEEVEETATEAAKTLITVNNFFEKQVGLVGDFDYTNNNSLIENFEFVGLGNESRSIIYTEYFPIINTRVIEEIQNPDGSSRIVEWEKVDSFTHSNKKEFIVSEATGRIFINKSDEKFYYSKSYSSESYELEFYESLEKWPLNRGFIEIGNATYEYYDKSFDSIFLKTPLALNSYDKIKVKFLREGQNFSTLSNLWVGYKCVL
jgi:hypothetical protein